MKQKSVAMAEFSFRQSKIQNQKSKWLRGLATAFALTGWPQMAGAQQVKIPWIGYLARLGLWAFTRHLSKDCAISAMSRARTLALSRSDWRKVGPRALADLVAELVRLKVDIICDGYYGSGPGCQESH